jgi:integrase
MKFFRSSLSALFEKALAFRASRGFDIAYHRQHFLEFDDYCHACHPDATTLTEEMVKRWPQYEASIGRGGCLPEKMLSIRQLGRSLAAIGVPAYILPVKFLPKRKPALPYVMSDGELTALFRAVDTTGGNRYDQMFLRSARVLFRLLYTCGLRPGEGRLLRVGEVNLSDGTLLISKNKQHKQRMVAMSGGMARLLGGQISAVRAKFPLSEYVFVNESGVLPCERCYADFLRKCWARAHSRKTDKGLPHIRLYDFRHRYASAVLQKWTDAGEDVYARIPYLRAYLGHDDFSSSLYYMHILPENILASRSIDWGKANRPIPEVTDEAR